MIKTKTVSELRRHSRINDRRTHRRIEPPVSLHFTSFESRECVPVNIGLGGVRVQSARPCETGSRFTLIVGLPRRGQLVIKGRVVWSSPRRSGCAVGLPYEMGVDFGTSNGPELEILARHL